MVLIVPPCTAPPARVHEPPAASRARVLPVLVSVPRRLTAPSEPLIAPNHGTRNVPSRLRVAPFRVIAPALSQAPSTLMRELVALMLPSFRHTPYRFRVELLVVI